MKHLPVPSIFRFHVRNFGGVIVLVCRDLLQAKFSDPGISWNFMDQGSTSFPLRKKRHGVQQQEVLKKSMNLFFWGGRNGFSKNSFKVVIQGDSLAMGLLRSRMLFHWDFGQWKSKNHPRIPDDLMVNLLQLNTRIVLFKYSDFNHQTIQTKGTRLYILVL